jgi:hypothetical protein
MTEDPDVSPLRPYLLTSGRAQPVDQSLEIEAQVMTTALGAAAHPQLAFERQEIVSLCQATMSVAEVAALLDLHIGVARVLVADLAEQGHVVVRRPEHHPSHDLGMIERVIRGLEALH